MALKDTLRKWIPGFDESNDGNEQDTQSEDEGDEADAESAESGDSDTTESEGGEREQGLEEDVRDIEYEIDETNDAIDSLESTINRIENRQESVEEEVEETNDRVRKVVGIYDEFMDDSNPFTGGGSRDDVEPTGGGDNENSEDTSSDDDAITTEDLQRKAGMDLDADDDDDDDDDDTPESGPSETQYEGVLSDDVYLAHPPLTYSGDVIAVDWVAFLMTEVGSSGALKAIEHYHSLDWVSEEVRDYFLVLLSAPAISSDVEPVNPKNLTSDIHKTSFKYIMQMNSANREYVKEQRVAE